MSVRARRRFHQENKCANSKCATILTDSTPFIEDINGVCHHFCSMTCAKDWSSKQLKELHSYTNHVAEKLRTIQQEE